MAGKSDIEAMLGLAGYTIVKLAGEGEV